MKSFVDALTDLIISKETPRLKKIMREVAEKIQGDVVAATYSIIDAYYLGCSPFL